MSYRHISPATLRAIRLPQTADEIAAQRARDAENQRKAAEGRARDAAAYAARAAVIPVAPAVAVEAAPVAARSGLCERCHAEPATHGSFVPHLCAECFAAACEDDKRRGRVCSFCHAAYTACTC